MLVRISSIATGGNARLPIRCPACRRMGTFEPVAGIPDLQTGMLYLGHRLCPNAACRAHVFCVYDAQLKVIKSYPPERIDFDPNKIPTSIVKTFSDALACRAEDLHVASAIMLRRTLEELCRDKAVKGDNLKQRILALQSVVVLPQALLEALDDLRLLGNDAAHVEAKTFDEIGAEELDVAIELTKEILKSVYQLDDLLSRLRALKK